MGLAMWKNEKTSFSQQAAAKSRTTERDNATALVCNENTVQTKLTEGFLKQSSFCSYYAL